MEAKSKLVGWAFAIAFAAGPFQQAQARSHSNINVGNREEQRDARSGAPTRIYSFYDCATKTPYMGTGSAGHGSVSYKDTVGRACGRADEPIREVIYTSNPGFTGADTVTFPRGGGKATIIDLNVR
jgi:hypothetical protein